MMGAVKDVLAGRPLKLTDQQAQEAWRSYQMESRAKQEEMRHTEAEKNKKEGEEYLAANKTKPGVKTKTVTLPNGTTAELQYKVLKEGTGATPGSNDTVSVIYRGTLVNGKEFDSSAKHGGQPAKFQVNRVIRGWTEALEMMKVGSKWEIYVPSSLAYGDQGYGPTIEPGSTLIFELELVGTEAPKPPAPPPPLTSDIIRVPSQEELKKGAKIEVIKPEDLEKYTNAAAQKQEKKK
jgi:FKBP-type peptidyl-prolyl cis-trans isomerase